MSKMRLVRLHSSLDVCTIRKMEEFVVQSALKGVEISTAGGYIHTPVFIIDSSSIADHCMDYLHQDVSVLATSSPSK
jgi:hypothetical protein